MNTDARYDAFHEVLDQESIVLVNYQIDLEMYRGQAPTFRLIIATMILGLVALDRRSRGFSPRWGLAWNMMLFKRTQYVWGPVMLACLYHDMHDFVYYDGRKIGTRVTLLHIWA